jgi:hypothetical protein
MTTPGRKRTHSSRRYGLNLEKVRMYVGGVGRCRAALDGYGAVLGGIWRCLGGIGRCWAVLGRYWAVFGGVGRACYTHKAPGICTHETQPISGIQRPLPSRSHRLKGGEELVSAS